MTSTKLNSARQESDVEDKQVSVSEWIANAIADTGCTVVYGGHGGALVPLVNAVCHHPQLTWVCARNEHDAATMAAAHAKMTGELGCVIATSGPGATNLTTGLMEAVLDGVSLLAITGLKPTAVLGYSEFQDVDQSRLFAGAGVEFSKSVSSADAVIPLLRDATAVALTRRTCAHLAIPVDIQAAPSPLPLRHFCASHARASINTNAIDEKLINQTAETLVGTPEERQPRNVIAVGLNATYENGMSTAILDLAEALNAPVLTRLDAKGVLDESHPLSFGVIGVHGKPGLEAAAKLISSSDRIISIGVTDETLLLCNSAGLQIRKCIEIQPDSITVGTRFVSEHALVGNVRSIVIALSERVETLMVKVGKKRAILDSKKADDDDDEERRRSSLEFFDYMAHNNPHARRRSSLIRQVDEFFLPNIEELGLEKLSENCDMLWDAMHKGQWKALSHNVSKTRFQPEIDSIISEGKQKYCHPVSVLQALSKLRQDPETDEISKEAVLTVDVGDITLWASLCLELQGGSRVLYSERLGTMGYALNAGIAGILSRPQPSAAVVLAGDGGFQMTLQELATFQQMKRPGDKLLCIVFDNLVLGRVAFGFDNAAGCEMSGCDYVALSKAYGGDGIRLEDSFKAHEVVKKALATDGLFLIHVIVDPNVKADMATFTDNALKVMNSG